MIEYYNTLSDQEKGEVTAAIKQLYQQTFLLEKKYDKKLNRYQYNGMYRTCETHFDFLKSYFSVADITLFENTTLGIIGIQSPITLGEKLNKLTSIFTLLIKLLYDEKMNEASNSIHVYVTMNELYEKIQLFSLWDNKSLPITEVKRSIAVLKKYQIIDVMDSMEELKGTTSLLVYPTIQEVLKPEAVQAILNQYEEELTYDDTKEQEGESVWNN